MGAESLHHLACYELLNSSCMKFTALKKMVLQQVCYLKLISAEFLIFFLRILHTVSIVIFHILCIVCIQTGQGPVCLKQDTTSKWTQTIVITTKDESLLGSVTELFPLFKVCISASFSMRLIIFTLYAYNK